MRSSHTLDRIATTFDDRHLISDAGLLLPATLASHLGLEALFDQHVDLGFAQGRAHIGAKALTIVMSALAGGDCIDDAGALRAGGTAAVLGHALRAPSTLGTFLRSFSWAHARQLDVVSRAVLARAWAAGAGPASGALTIDLDSTICETYGLQKEGGIHFTYNHVRGYHPLLAVAAGLGDVLHSRLRGGPAHSGRGAASFLAETFGRVRVAGARGALVVRADSGFYSGVVTRTCRKAGARFSITVKLYAGLQQRIAAIPETAWTAIPYWQQGGADVAEIAFTPFAHERDAREVRLIVRRVRPTPGSQLALFTPYSYHAFITDREGPTLALEADHRRHAEVENTIRDLKYGVGLNHLPSGRFGANAAWLALQVIAHNLARWISRVGLGEALVTTKTLRRRFFSLPGRLARSARRHWLHLPQEWLWADQFAAALTVLRAISLPLTT
ncbi:MAG: IS1380 family transposase [Panacagrimonas sp.]